MRSSSSNRLKRLESHVVTLARSVAHLSSEIRNNHQLTQELTGLRAEVDRMQGQMKSLHGVVEMMSKEPTRHAVHPQEATLPRVARLTRQPPNVDMNPSKVDKITK